MKKSILLIGQTASGKTALAHALFNSLLKQNIQCELVNLDAFQIYKGLSIGTAKPNAFEQIKYKYHCIDVCAPNETIDAHMFADLAHKACNEINSRGNLPICVGGSGLYLRAFLHGLDNFPAHNPKIRQKIRDYAKEYGWHQCHEWLARVDPLRAGELHPNDHVRIERALEIIEIMNEPVSALRTKKTPLFSQALNLDAFIIQTVIDNVELQKNILIRTQNQFAQNWIHEVQTLYEKYGENILEFNSMRAIGYKNILSFLNSAAPISRLIEHIAGETFKYAKRQKTWNQKEKTDFLIQPKDIEQYKQLLESIKIFQSKS